MLVENISNTEVQDALESEVLNVWYDLLTPLS